jgi:uncharacterized protein YchJ
MSSDFSPQIDDFSGPAMSMNRISLFSRAAFCALSLVCVTGTAIAEEAAAKVATKVEAKADAKTTDESKALEATIAEQIQINHDRVFAGHKPLEILDPKKLSAEERKLHSRVQARWDALVEFDLKTVYSFATPSYRKIHNQAHLNSQYHNKLLRKNAEIYSIEFEDDKKTQARVKVQLHFETFLGNMDQPLKGSSWETDTWVKVDGQWWYVEPR